MIQRRQFDTIVVPEAGKQPIASCRDGRGGMGIIPVDLRAEAPLADGRLPEPLARLAVDRYDRLCLVGCLAGRQKYLITNNNGTGITAARDFCFPENMGSFIPVNWGMLSGGCDAVPGWAAPDRPVVGSMRTVRQSDQPTEEDECDP